MRGLSVSCLEEPLKLRISRFTIRPFGPVPDTEAKSIPFSDAMDLASGLEITRSEDWEVGVGGETTAAIGAGVVAGGAGGSSTTSFNSSFAGGVGAFLVGDGGSNDANFSTSSFFSASTQMSFQRKNNCSTLFTSTSFSPALMKIFARKPSSWHSMSIIALSVSISTKTSPGPTVRLNFTNFVSDLLFPFPDISLSHCWR